MIKFIYPIYPIVAYSVATQKKHRVSEFTKKGHIKHTSACIIFFRY